MNKFHLRYLLRRSKYVKPKFYALHIKHKKVILFSRSFFKKPKKIKHNKRKVKIDNRSFSIGFKFGYMVRFSKYISIVQKLK